MPWRPHLAIVCDFNRRPRQFLGRKLRVPAPLPVQKVPGQAQVPVEYDEDKWIRLRGHCPLTFEPFSVAAESYLRDQLCLPTAGNRNGPSRGTAPIFRMCPIVPRGAHESDVGPKSSRFWAPLLGHAPCICLLSAP